MEVNSVWELFWIHCAANWGVEGGGENNLCFNRRCVSEMN